jgi:hypothetical protein
MAVESVPAAMGGTSDAEHPALATQIAGAGSVYLSGHPAYLAETLRGSAEWSGIPVALETGSARACYWAGQAVAARVSAGFLRGAWPAPGPRDCARVLEGPPSGRQGHRLVPRILRPYGE